MVPQLISDLRSNNPSRVISAARAIDGFADPRATGTLISLLQNRDSLYRRQTNVPTHLIQALGAMERDGNARQYLNYLACTASDENIRSNATQQFGRNRNWGKVTCK